MTKTIAYRELFNFLSKNIRPHPRRAEILNLDYEQVEKAVHDIGGYCDCEVLMNSMSKISDNELMPRRTR